MNIFAFLLGGILAAANLPTGHEQARWQMSVKELEQTVPVIRVEPGDAFNYAEHLEEDPEVYLRTEDQKRIEYYFVEGELYKIFIVYDRRTYHAGFYQQLIDEFKNRYGPPQRTLEKEFFGLPIQHVLWEDEISILDLRRGAGFIYQVRIHKAGAEKKARAAKRKKAI
jgi:hypothetical protein